jgi:hypothetical protein
VFSILTKWIDIDRINAKMFRDLNRSVAKIIAIHTGEQEAKCTNSNITKDFKAQLLLANSF